VALECRRSVRIRGSSHLGDGAIATGLVFIRPTPDSLADGLGRRLRGPVDGGSRSAYVLTMNRFIETIHSKLSRALPTTGRCFNEEVCSVRPSGVGRRSHPAGRLRHHTDAEQLSSRPVGGRLPPSPPRPDPASLTGQVDWWAWTGVSTIEPLIAEFNKTYPGHHGETTSSSDTPTTSATLRPGLTAGPGSGPDVFTLEAGGIAQQFGPLAEPMEPLLVKQLGSDWATAISASYQTLVADGALRAVPIGSTSAGTLLVNASMLDSYGVEPRVPRRRWRSGRRCAPRSPRTANLRGQGGQEGWQNTDLSSRSPTATPPGSSVTPSMGRSSGPILTWCRL